MWEQSLTADTKHRQCRKVVGDVMGSFRPHGDAARSTRRSFAWRSPSLRAPSTARATGSLRRGTAAHRAKCRLTPQRRDADGDQAGDRAGRPELRRHEDQTWCCRRGCNLRQRRDRHRRRRQRPTSAAQSRQSLHSAYRPCSKRRSSSAQLCQNIKGPTSPPAGDTQFTEEIRTSTKRDRDRSGARDVGHRTGRGRPRRFTSSVPSFS